MKCATWTVPTLLLLVATGLLTSTKLSYADYPTRFMGGAATLTTAPNGAVMYDRALQVAPKIAYLEKTVDRVADGIWVIGGYSIVNCIVIDAPDGLIVYDTGDNGDEGKRFREVIESQVSKKPIKAFIYSHSHYALGTGAMVDDPNSVMVIGHPKVNETVRTSLQGGGAPSAIPELGPVLTARAAVQFNNFLPNEGPDAAVAARIQVKTPAYLPVTTTVEDGQTLTVAGLPLQRLYLKGEAKGVAPRMLDKLRKLLLAMDTANSLDQIDRFPGWKLHPLKGDLKGYWSLTVTGNWRLIFQYDAATNTASSLDLIDYHGK